MTENPFRDIMSDAAWAAWQVRANWPAREEWDDLVRAGIINEQGEVLVRMPTFGPEGDDEQGEAPGREAT